MTDLNLPPIRRGDDWDYVGTFTLSSGSLLGCTVWLTLKTDLGQADAEAAIQISSATSGVTILTGTTAEFVMTAAQTAALTPGRYFVDIQIKTGSGKIITASGLAQNAVIRADVTRAVA